MGKTSSILNGDETYFLQINNLAGLKTEQLTMGISNKNYLIDKKYVFKSPYDPRFIFLNKGQLELMEKAGKKFISPRVIASDIQKGYLITEYLNGFTPIDSSKISLIQIKNLIKQLNILHSFKKDNLPELDYLHFLDRFRLLVPPKERIYVKDIEYSPLLKTNQEITHFDLVANNILSSKEGDIRLIDYELAVYAPKYFDLISLLYENNFTPEIRKVIIDEYFKNDEASLNEFLSQRKKLTQIADLLWYHWAKARSLTATQTQKVIYRVIASEKKISLIQSLQEED